MKLKKLGLAVLAAMALAAIAASSASATTLEVDGVTQNASVTLKAHVSGTSMTLARTDGTIGNTCTNSIANGATEIVRNEQGEVVSSFTGTKVTGALSSLTFEGCTKPVIVHRPGKLYVEHESGTTNGTVFSEEAEVTVTFPPFTVNCKTSTGTAIGTLTGAAKGFTATLHINAVLNCGIFLPSATWEGRYQVSGPALASIGVSA